jgi:ribulose-phosphate 3-epimerase
MSLPILAPSVLAADFTRLKDEFDMINQSDADWFHIDVMDGRFVPNISFGQFIIEQMKSIATKPLDVHLMIVEPEKYVPEFVQAGADIVTVHYEACPHLHRNIQQIRSLGVQAGVALNPHTPVHLLKDILQDIDMVCLMSVNPGFGGQKFIHYTYEKVRALKMLAMECGREDLKIEIDGGVTKDNAADLVAAGANVLVAGSAVFKAANPKEMVQLIKNAHTHTTKV